MTHDRDAADAADGAPAALEPRPTPTVLAVWLTALSWAAGSAAVAAPIIAALWPADRDDRFWPVLATVSAIGLLVGGAYRMSRNRWAMVLSTLPPAIVVTVLYPLTGAGAVVAENVANGTLDQRDRLLVLAAGAAAAAIGPLCRFVPRRPRGAFVAATIGWGVASLALVPADGIGLALVPMWVANLTAARDPRFN